MTSDNVITVGFKPKEWPKIIGEITEKLFACSEVKPHKGSGSHRKLEHVFEVDEDVYCLTIEKL